MICTHKLAAKRKKLLKMKSLNMILWLNLKNMREKGKEREKLKLMSKIEFRGFRENMMT